MVSLKNIIIHILQSHGFDVFEKDDVVRGEKDDILVSVGLFDKITLNELRKHARMVSKEGGKHIICVLEASDTVEEEARKLGLTLWKKNDLEKELVNVFVLLILFH